MSSLFSDPPFPRGATLLAGETIELDPSGNPIAGTEIVGTVKVFQDVQPYTGTAAIRNSNRLVYCIAARYIGTATLNANNSGADKGKVYVMSRRGPLVSFTDTAVAADVTDGRTVGVLDEYLNSEVRTNDIVWLVVKGPTSIQKANDQSIPGGLGVEVSSGLVVRKATQANMIGQCIDAAIPFAASTTNTSTNVTVASTAGIVAGSPVTGTGIPAGATVASITNATTFVLSAAATATGTPTIFIGGPLLTATTCRVNLHSAQI